MLWPDPYSVEIIMEIQNIIETQLAGFKQRWQSSNEEKITQVNFPYFL